MKTSSNLKVLNNFQNSTIQKHPLYQDTIVFYYYRLYAAGAQRAVNGTCTILDDPSTAMATCPELDRTVQPVCMSTGQRGSGNVPRHLQWYIMVIIALCLIIAIL